MAERPVISHAEIERMLLMVGYSGEQINGLLSDLPDPVDLEQARAELFRHGISLGHLMDRMGSSP